MRQEAAHARRIPPAAFGQGPVKVSRRIRIPGGLGVPQYQQFVLGHGVFPSLQGCWKHLNL
jgi:hypothetical protein